MECTEDHKRKGDVLLLITLSLFVLFPLLGLMCTNSALDEMEKPYLIQVDFDGDSCWDVSFLADNYDSDGNQLLMRFGDERYSIEYSSFLATRLEKNEEGSEW